MESSLPDGDLSATLRMIPKVSVIYLPQAPKRKVMVNSIVQQLLQ
jgi:hypothetical protein